MRYLPDGKQMAAADAHTIQEIGIPSEVLMERAALQIVRVLDEKQADTSRTLVVCGSGNNGGDGFAVSRLLAERGDTAEILFVGKEASLSRECRLQKEIAGRLGIKIYTPDFSLWDAVSGEEPSSAASSAEGMKFAGSRPDALPAGFLPEEVLRGGYTTVIDAIFGVGLSREVGGHYRAVIDWMNSLDGFKAAADIPSGVCARTGKVLGIAFRADLTVAMACEKLGCALFPGKQYAGETVPVPIGIDPGFFEKNTEVCFTYERGDLAKRMPQRKANSHKGTYGRLLLVAGSPGMAGAAYLAALAAYSVGCGLVRIYTHESNRSVLQQLLPEAVLTCYASFDSRELDELLSWADVVCIGSGLGQSEVSEQILAHTVSHVQVPCVADADGLNLLSLHMELLKNRSQPLVLTPHMKEMSRLTKKTVQEISENRMEILDAFIREYPAVCVLKDSRTVVAARGRQKFVNLAGNNGMAKAGSGDVLSGVISGLLAQGLGSFDAAVLGVYLHACGGDAARDRYGEYSMLARNLPEGIRAVLREI